jgi:hypothetical protein
MQMTAEGAPVGKRGRTFGWFAAWLAVGGGYAVGFLAILSVGVAVLAATIVATILLARIPRARESIFGIVSGLSLPLFWVAYDNRDGPGTVCTAIPGGQSCADEFDPWPWFAAGIVLFLVGAAGFTVRRLTRRA